MDGESERWLGIAAKLLTTRDFIGSRTFSIRAKESDPNNTVSDQILAVVDTVLAGEKRVETTQQPDWYAVLQLPRLVRDVDLITNHYRRLAMLLSPERNRLPFADYALQLAMDAWSVLSDPTKKWLFDNELALALQTTAGSSRVDSGFVGGGGEGSGSGQVNTFEFFEPVSASQQQQQQSRGQVLPGVGLQIWQQQQQQPQPQREFIPTPAQQMPAQWQLRDLNPNVNNNVDHSLGTHVTTEPAQAPWVARSGGVQVQVPPAPAAVPVPPVVTAMQNGNGNGNVGCNDNRNDCNGVGGNNVNVDGNNENEEVETFWTACPYCFYMYEYQKEYQDYTLMCQNCEKGFHALPVPNQPPIGPATAGKEKGKPSSFSCWGFFPLGLSKSALKKHIMNGTDNWVPFSPMFHSPWANGGGNFHWFGGGGKGGGLSNRDGRNPGKRKYTMKVRGIKRKANTGEALLTLAGDDTENGKSRQLVLGLFAGETAESNKTVASTGVKKQTKQMRRSMKDRLDLNVEFNNEGDEHAPAVNAVHRDEDGIENIGFFEGLDEFLSTLPILNVGDEKGKPSQ